MNTPFARIRANFAAAKAAVATAQLTYDSKKELFAQKVISEFDLTTSHNALLTARAQLAQAEAQDQVFVYKVIDGNSSASPVKVTRVNGGQEYIVESGLQPGEVIVAEGVGLMREGTPVTPKQAQAEAAAQAGA